MSMVIETHETALQEARHGLLDVLTFLERRGASPEAMELAMQRAGIQADVARLLSRCTGPNASEPATAPAPERAALQTGRSAELALFQIASGLWLTVLVFGIGVAAGMTIGYEFGLGLGFEAGLDRLAAMLAG